MRILYVASDQTLAAPHGGTVHVQAVSRELVRHGHELHVVYQESASPPKLPGGVSPHSIPPTHRFLLWSLGAEIDRILDTVAPDLVMERYYNFAGTALIRAAKRGLPAVLEVNSPMLEYPGSLKSRMDTLLFGALRKRRERIGTSATLIVAPIREIVPPEFHGKTREIEWGADTEQFDPAALPDRSALRHDRGLPLDDFLLVHFGSLRKWHGLTKLLEAFDRARPAFGRPAKLIIIGPSKPIPRPDVIFTGSVPHRDIPGWLKACDLAVFPFSPEQHRYLDLGFYWSPLKVFEAMAMGLPCITLRHPRLTSILGTEDARYFYDGSMEDLARRILDLVKAPEGLASAGAELSRRAREHYSWRAHGNLLNSWLQEALRSGSAEVSGKA